MRGRGARVTLVIAGVIMASIVTGSLAGIGCLFVLSFLADTVRMPDRILLSFAAAIGGICGLCLGPLSVFGFMRRVPLGRLFVEMCVGTTVAGSVGLMLNLGLFGLLA